MVCMRRLAGQSSLSGIWLALLPLACGEDGRARIADAGLGPDVGNLDARAGNLGAPCGNLGDGGMAAVSLIVGTPDCASGICLSGPPSPGSLGPTNTAAYCTATCNQDEDCAGQLRDPANPLDTRCQHGFACGVLFVKGILCCVPMCVCKDMMGSGALPTPIACQGEAAATCDQ